MNLLLSFKQREHMAPSCKFKSPVWEHFDFLVTILLFFYVCRWKKYTNLHYEYMFWTWNTNSIQLFEPNRNNRKPTSKIKTEQNLNRGSPITYGIHDTHNALYTMQYTCTKHYTHISWFKSFLPVQVFLDVFSNCCWGYSPTGFSPFPTTVNTFEQKNNQSCFKVKLSF